MTNLFPFYCKPYLNMGCDQIPLTDPNRGTIRDEIRCCDSLNKMFDLFKKFKTLRPILRDISYTEDFIRLFNQSKRYLQNQQFFRPYFPVMIYYFRSNINRSQTKGWVHDLKKLTNQGLIAMYLSTQRVFIEMDVEEDLQSNNLGAQQYQMDVEQNPQSDHSNQEEKIQHFVHDDPFYQNELQAPQNTLLDKKPEDQNNVSTDDTVTQKSQIISLSNLEQLQHNEQEIDKCQIQDLVLVVNEQQYNCNSDDDLDFDKAVQLQFKEREARRKFNQTNPYMKNLKQMQEEYGLL